MSTHIYYCYLICTIFRPGILKVFSCLEQFGCVSVGSRYAF
jgi:hypothetical protein